ncbi:PTS sugar transporter subunit IIA [Candidatus Woesearchaeota archaeon]|nr:MAG: PTS sugar transporter subunit IIA [Candidatus Woesearchaeota archaeon]
MALSKYLRFAAAYDSLADICGNEPPTKQLVIAHMARRFAEEEFKMRSGTTTDRKATEEAYVSAMLQREGLVTTGVGYGVALPHGVVEVQSGVLQPQLDLGVYIIPELDWESSDKKPAQLIFATLCPRDIIGGHLNVLARLSYTLKTEKMRTLIRDSVISGNELELKKLLDYQP